MTKQEEYIAVADGIRIVKVDYGIDDHIVFRDMHNPQKLHHAKINDSNSGADYFNYCGRRFHLNNFIRTNL